MQEPLSLVNRFVCSDFLPTVYLLPGELRLKLEAIGSIEEVTRKVPREGGAFQNLYIFCLAIIAGLPGYLT